MRELHRRQLYLLQYIVACCIQNGWADAAHTYTRILMRYARIRAGQPDYLMLGTAYRMMGIL